MVTALFFGLFGSLHCVGMCGPIAFMLPIDRSNTYKGFIHVFLYHSGRILSYAFIGSLFGLLGKGFYLFGVQQQISLLIGFIMILSVVLPKWLSSHKITRPIYQLTRGVQNKLALALKKKKYSTFLKLGLLNGLLPCGLVYMAMLASLTSTRIIEGTLYMILFGIGTLPLMTAVIVLGNLSNYINRRKLQKLIPYVVCIIGFVFVLRGLGLGIPYLSPEPIIWDATHEVKLCY